MSELSQNVEQLDLTEQPSDKAAEGRSLSGVELVSPPVPNNEIRKPVRLPCFVPATHAANENFCGRGDILERLEAELLPSKSAVTESANLPRQFALCGPGGIGKTEIAREFVRHYKASFDAVFWVVADEIANIDRQYQQISLALGFEDSSECKSQVASIELVKRWLLNPRKRLSGSDHLIYNDSDQTELEATWLLVFDNADDPMMLADYWVLGRGSILVTSRDPSAKKMFSDRSLGLDLCLLTRHASLSISNNLLANSAKPEDDTAQQISDTLGGIPLAISQMVDILRRQDLTLTKFLELYIGTERHISLYGTKFHTNVRTCRYSLSAIWAFERPLYINPSDFLYLQVQRVVQNAVLATMEAARRRLIFDRVVRVLWVGWPSAMPKPSKKPELPQPKSAGGRLQVGRWPVCAAIYPHILKIHQLWPSISDSLEATSLHFAKLLNEAAWYQKGRGRTKEFDGFFKTSRTICESSTHADRDSLLADIYFCLGVIAMDASDFDTSRTYKERSFALVSRICKELGTADERLYLAYAERVISRIQDRRCEEGESDLKEALRIRKALGNYIPRSGEANLSYALLEQGKFEECNTLLIDSLAGREEAFGKDDTESVRTGLMLYALGNLRGAQKKWDESFEYHQRASRQMRTTVGEKDFYTSNITHKIAEHLFRLGRSEEAIATIDAALGIWSVDSSTHKNEIARTTFLKAIVLEAMGKSQRAFIAFKVACQMRN